MSMKTRVQKLEATSGAVFPEVTFFTWRSPKTSKPEPFAAWVGGTKVRSFSRLENETADEFFDRVEKIASPMQRKKTEVEKSNGVT
ncbi:MAG: hypothetical protein AAGF20_07600 [Pseudomonadota bacterium]